MFCKYCGHEVFDDAVVCVNCGRSLVEKNEYSKKRGEYEGVLTLLLCIFFGVIGAHRFYTGHIAIGIIQLLTLGGCFIWAFVDFILILVGSYKDSEGNAIIL